MVKGKGDLALDSVPASHQLCDLAKCPLASLLNADIVPPRLPFLLLRLFTETHSVPSTVPGVRHTAVKKTDKVLAHGLGAHGLMMGQK